VAGGVRLREQPGDDAVLVGGRTVLAQLGREPGDGLAQPVDVVEDLDGAPELDG
jgi:hypothetical protein